MNVACCFRVPNVLSPDGKRNYGRDATHRVRFDLEFRAELQTMGYTILPIVRWYRPLLRIKSILRPARRMQIADEIAICKGMLSSPEEVGAS
jgi:hypothetical protein